MKTKIIISILFALIIFSCKKQRLADKSGLWCDCLEKTQYRFEDIMNAYPKTQNETNKMLIKTIRSFVNEHKDLVSESKKMIKNVNSDLEYNFSVIINSSAKTERDSTGNEPDTISVFIPNANTCNLEKPPVFAISETLPDTFGENRVWGFYMDEDSIEKDVIMSEEAAKNSERPILIFDTKFSIFIENATGFLGETGGDIRSTVTQWDRFFVSRIESDIDLDNDNNMEVAYQGKVWDNYVLTNQFTDFNILNINDNQIGDLISTWIPIPYKFVVNPNGGAIIPNNNFPLHDDKYISTIFYDNDWGASTKWVYLYPSAPYSNSFYLGKAVFKTKMSQSSTTLIAWANYRFSDLTWSGWFQAITNCPDGQFFIHHWND